MYAVLVENSAGINTLVNRANAEQVTTRTSFDSVVLSNLARLTVEKP